MDQLVEGSDRNPKEPLRLREGDLNDPVSGSRPAGWGSASISHAIEKKRYTNA
jgi:hypothetical protein